MWWVEVRYGVRRTHAPIVLSADDRRVHVGGPYSFRSVYEHDNVEWCAMHQQRTGGNLRSTVLRVDIDGTELELRQFVDGLRQRDYGYRVWHTGRRGGHVEVAIETMIGPRVADAQKIWVRDHVPGADLSIYNPRGMWRLPYAVHEKAAGSLKVLVEERAGTKLVIGAAPPAPPPISSTDRMPTRDDWMRTLTQQCGSGGRSTNMYILAKQAVALGISCEEAVKHALWWNAKWCSPPHDPRYVADKIVANYRQLGG